MFETTTASRRLRLPAIFSIAVFLLVACWALLLQGTSAKEQGPAKPTIVLVHGAWADASGWNEVSKRLQKDGYPVIAWANPLRSLEGDAAYLASFLEQTPGDIILVGHSYGGAVISSAATGNPNVKALVYIAAFAPEVGEDTLHLAGAESLIGDAIEFKLYPPGTESDIDVFLKQDKFHEAFAGDLTRSQAMVLWAAQRPVAYAAGGGAAVSAAWKTIPSWYMVATQDRTIVPSQQHFMAERAGSTVTEVRASHVVMISEPSKVASFIKKAERSVR